MSTVYPHSTSDLALAPVLIQLERNLEGLRRADDLLHALGTDDAGPASSRDRAEQVVRVAVRGVNLHGLAVAPTPDLNGLSVEHGEYRVSLMLGGRVTEYVRHGAPASMPTV
ncbi:MAG TPA: hypothetical protein VFZ64_07005 [Nocardioidaceae bacterium]